MGLVVPAKFPVLTTEPRTAKNSEERAGDGRAAKYGHFDSNLETLLYSEINFQGWCRLPPRINAEQSSNKRRILLIECGV